MFRRSYDLNTIRTRNGCISAFVVALCATIVQGQTRLETHSWTATVRIVDDVGRPIPAAEIWISYDLPPTNGQSKEWAKIEGVSDTNGVFRASHSDQTVSIGFHAQKPGYYSTSASHLFGFSTDDPSTNWNPSRTLVLVRIGNPIPMYAKREEAKIPVEDQPVCFDLAIGDWVAPFGTGTNADIVFSLHRQINNPSDYSAQLQLTFPNRGDGLAVQPVPNGAEMPMVPRTAPDQGYEPIRTWNFTAGKQPETVSGYFLRVRTVLDEKGNVKSALYGKIRGDVRFYIGTKAPHSGLGFDYYLNPTVNSQNLEFDPAKNLFQKLGPGEAIREPF